MKRSFYILLTAILLFTPAIFAQNSSGKKQGHIVKTEQAPVIDGLINEDCWDRSMLLTDFTQYEPYSGQPGSMKTEVRIVYDDEGIYIAAINYDNQPDSIRTGLGPRDGDRNIIADFFNVDIGPYNDGVNGYSFKLAASGIQTDIRRSSGAGGRDLKWDAVWLSAVNITDYGWVAEIKIPFSAIRFPSDGSEPWGFNFWRYIQRYGEWSSWNFTDKSHGTTINYMGEISGFEGINPPARVSVTPYISGHIENTGSNNKWNRAFNGGADLKVGLSEAFTLDATLVPDFKQVQSDDQVLNLSPYEVKYNERRQFFTEGTDVFSKAGIFYSRRVGSQPDNYHDVYYEAGENEVLIYNPEETRLINATKISGRTGKGLGIGFFNGLTARTAALFRDTLNNTEREFISQPLTNYNMMVLDQNLGGGSYISLANTNVMKEGPASGNNYTANVSAADFRYLSNNRTYSLSGVFALSQKYYSDSENIIGHSISMYGGKTGGTFRAYYILDAISDTYDPNDMGYIRRTNELNNTFTFGYNIYKPVGYILNSLNSLSFEHCMLHTPRRFSAFNINFKSATSFRNFWALSILSDITPGLSKDYYEPRAVNRFYIRPPSAGLSFTLNTDARKIFSIGVSAGSKIYRSEYDMSSETFSVKPTIRLNNKFFLAYSFSRIKLNNDFGYVSDYNDTIFFGRRNSLTLENIITLAYINSSNSSFDLRIRHYMAEASYSGYYSLEYDGLLKPAVSDLNSDICTNYFNIDMSYVWRFAPGSEMRLVWKNSVYQSGTSVYSSYSDNLQNMFSAPQVNSFSIKILVFLDYHTLSKKIQ